ncbi:MAG: hypothetical protein PF549_00845 [Patescibacteria group bacterium]|jgi:sugar-specific transcriptional regulator TrmB|nr:hypothetical protein [Patescibacteria group bacterium]
MQKIESFLKSLGLSEKEKDVYLAGLKLGPTRAAMFSRKTGFTRQHTYDLLKSLEQKGLVSKMGEKYGQRFIIENPKNLKNLIERKKQKLERLDNNLDKLLPEFESFYNVKGVVPKIRFFDEIEGIKEIFENMLDCSDKNHLYLGSIQELVGVLGEDYLNNWVERRVKKKIFSKALRIEKKEVSKRLYTNEKEFLREVRFAPEIIDITQTITMYNKKVAVISSKNECMGFLIESEEYFNTMKNLFEFLWENSKKINHNNA